MQIITHALPPQPKAKIIVDGLFILCINEEARTAELGVFEYANQHEFFLRVSQKEHGTVSEPGADGQAVLRLSEKDKLKTGNVSISVTNRPADITCYYHPELDTQSFWADPRNSSPISKRLAEFSPDFRWIIDLEGERFHNRKQEIVPGILQRKIHLPNGILATEQLVSRRVRSAYKQAALLAGHEIGSRYLFVTNQLAVHIQELSEGEELTLSYGTSAKPQTLALPKLETGLYHEIYISNNCPMSVGALNDRLSDFQHYYTVFNVPASDRLDLAMLGGSGSRAYPCDIVYLGSTPELP
jgi:hypothetical protein